MDDYRDIPAPALRCNQSITQVEPTNRFQANRTQQQLQILWLDLTVEVTQASLPEGFAGQGDYTLCRPSSEVDIPLISEFDCVVADFDYPDSRSLRLIQELKQRNPSVPFLLLTLQHSESFAVWCFRSRMRDYLVKPSSVNEISRCLAEIRRVLELARVQSTRRLRMPVQRIPLDASAPAPTGEEVCMQAALNYVEKNFRSKLLVADVAKVSRTSPFRFSRLFKQQYGKTFVQYITDYRLDEALRLLRSPNASVTDVCYACGFNDASYFSKVFRKRFGVVPSAIVGIADAVLKVDATS